MDASTLPVALTVVLTVVSPLLTALFTHVNMSSAAKNNVAVAVSFVVAGAYVAMSGGVHDLTNLAEVLGVLPSVYTVQQLVFANLLGKLSAKIEAKVGVQPPVVAPAAVVVPAAGGDVAIKTDYAGPVQPLG